VRDRCKSQSLGGHHGRRSAKLKDIILGSSNQALDAGLRESFRRGSYSPTMGFSLEESKVMYEQLLAAGLPVKLEPESD
jgi:hypothetical protein